VIKRENATVIISILLALIVKGALEHFFQPIFDGDKKWSEVPALHWGQLALCFVLVFRFYLGATRFIDTEPKQLGFVVRAVNLIFSFLLFCTFYCVALAVSDPGYFYAIVLVLHGIDVVWFVVALALSYFHHVSDRMLEPGEIKIEASRSIMWSFLVLSAVTIAIGAASYDFFGEALTSQDVMRSHCTFLIFLFLISFVDLVLLRKYYFSFSEWRERNQSIPADAV
jgi:hypothetical protein